jgi:uncharacterized membrane protein (UPF0127 family)
MKEGKSGKFGLLVIGLFLICAIFLKIWQYHWPEGTIELAGERLSVLIARTPYHHQKGLSGREDMADFDGMMFVFSMPNRTPMIMRDMNFDLDFVWFRDGKVVDMATNVSHMDAESLWWPRTAVDMVLELPAGWVSGKDIKIGDDLVILLD